MKKIKPVYLLVICFYIFNIKTVFSQKSSTTDSTIIDSVPLIKKHASKPRFAGAELQLKSKYKIESGSNFKTKIDYEFHQSYFFSVPLLINKKGFTVSTSFIYSSLIQKHNSETGHSEIEISNNNLKYQTLLLGLNVFKSFNFKDKKLYANLNVQNDSRGFNKSERISGTLTFIYPLKNTKKVRSSLGITFIASPNALVPVVPIFKYNLLLSEKYIFEGILPYSLRIKRILNDNTYLSFGTFFGGGAYLFNVNNLTNYGNNKTLEWRWAQITSNLLLEKQISGMLWASVDLGIDAPVLSKVLKPKDKNTDALSDQNISPSPYFKFSLYLIPFKKKKNNENSKD